MRAAVLAVGDELTTGQRIDTNSAWLSCELCSLGVQTSIHITAPDTIEDGIEALHFAALSADIVIISGGLGPTADDLTREVLAGVSGKPLELRPDVLQEISSRFAQRSIVMPESNRLQSMFPIGSTSIPNPHGTAPGIDILLSQGRTDGTQCRCFALPGVPSEMKEMWNQTVAPAIQQLMPEVNVVMHRRIKCFGAGESAVEEMLPDLIRRGRDPLVGITVHEATITLRITAHAPTAEACREKHGPTEALIRKSLGHLVYGVEDDELADAIDTILLERGMTLSVVEIGTRGTVSSMLSDKNTHGRFVGGVVLPEASRSNVTTQRDNACDSDDRVNNDSASSFLSQQAQQLLKATATPETICTLAQQTLNTFGSTLALVTGPIVHSEDIAGGKQSCMCICLAHTSGVVQGEHVFGGVGNVRLVRAAKSAMNMVRLFLLSTGSNMG